MLGNILKVVGLGASVAGGGIPTGWLIAGAVTVILSVLGGTWKAGYDYRGTIDESATLREQNEQLHAAIDEQQRQVDEVNRIQQADTARAVTAEARARELQKQIDETPRDDTTCGDVGTADRLFNKSKQVVPAVRYPQYPGSPGRR